MAYRILKITSVIYRVWATVRTRNLSHWVHTWVEPEMFAGIPGAGAEEGWYLTQLDMEQHAADNSHVTAASIDVFKCFDQVVRPLVYHLAKQAGMPSSILQADQAFQEQLVTHNQIGHECWQMTFSYMPHTANMAHDVYKALPPRELTSKM